MSLQPAKTANSRVFLIEGRARPDHVPSYESCMRAGAISQSFGDVEPIKCPDPYRYGAFVDVGEIRAAEERATFSLEGRYAMNLRSELLKLAKRRCALDIQLHMGDCQDPSSFNDFSKVVILENANLTNYGVDDLGSLEDSAAVNENADVTAESVYEVLPMSYAPVASATVTNEVVDGVICSGVSCGECDDEDPGCNKIYAITLAAGGSPSTPADLVFSPDGGTNWYARDISSLGVAHDPSAVACVDEYVVVVARAAVNANIALKSQMKAGVNATWTSVTTGFAALGGPNAISSLGNTAYIVGMSGYIYLMTTPTDGVTVLDAGAITTSDLRAVHAYSADLVVAVGDDGAVVYTLNGTTFQATAANPVGLGVDLGCVWCRTEDEWWTGSSAGRLYYTRDKGATWTEKTFSGSGAGSVRDLTFVTPSVGYLSHNTATPRGRILRTLNGGQSWYIQPESGSMPVNNRFGFVAGCPYDVNFVVAGGLSTVGADGILAVGAA